VHGSGLEVPTDFPPEYCDCLFNDFEGYILLPEGDFPHSFRIVAEHFNEQLTASIDFDALTVAIAHVARHDKTKTTLSDTHGTTYET
jgi:hypothetical protein